MATTFPNNCALIAEPVAGICTSQKCMVSTTRAVRHARPSACVKLFPQELGSGAFGVVRLGVQKESKALVAVKIIDVKMGCAIETQTLREIEIMKRSSHTFIVKLVDAIKNIDSNTYYLIEELVAGTDLYSLAQLQPEFRFNEIAARFFIAQVALALRYLHSLKIIYRDIKPENIMVQADGYIKVIDFSLAKQVEWKTFTLCGTPEYMAPELLQCAGHNFGVDWWSLGILLYELLVGHTPFQAATAREILRNILRGDVFVPSHLSAASKSLIRHLLSADTTRRYGMLRGGAMDVLNHRFFAGLSMDDLLARAVAAPSKFLVLSKARSFRELAKTVSGVRQDAEPCPPAEKIDLETFSW